MDSNQLHWQGREAFGYSRAQANSAHHTGYSGEIACFINARIQIAPAPSTSLARENFFWWTCRSKDQTRGERDGECSPGAVSSTTGSATSARSR